MNIEQAIAELFEINDTKQITSSTFAACVDALHEKAERGKTQPCEYCDNLSRYKGFGCAEYFHQVAADDIYEISIDIKFCPNCGRKLDLVGISRGEEMTTRKQILYDAIKCVCTDRETQYGTPENNFAVIADLWNAYKPCGLTAHDVGILLALLTIGCIASGQIKADNYIDLAGYAACAGEIALKGKEEGK
jgi:hypothetical protein